jgi:hypothetical protein
MVYGSVNIFQLTALRSQIVPGKNENHDLSDPKTEASKAFGHLQQPPGGTGPNAPTAAFLFAKVPKVHCADRSLH